MSEALSKLSDQDLRELALALRAGRITPPFTATALQRLLPYESAEQLATELQRLADVESRTDALAETLDLLAHDRSRHPSLEESIDLVTTGPEVLGVTNRDTSVVVRELFVQARQTVLVAGYAVHQGRRVFRALADRMLEEPRLKVTMLLDIQRGPGDTSLASEIVRRFVDHFRDRQWPDGRPLPSMYYYPQSLEGDAAKRACLHAKCVVIDRQTAFISSANFTDAGQERNIEVGVLIRSRVLTESLARHFDAMIDAGVLAPIPTLEEG